MKKSFMEKFRQFLKRNMLPFFAGGGFFLFFYYLLTNVAPEPDHKAPEEVGKYRYWLAMRKGQGLWYDMEGFRQFIDTFPKLIKDADNGSAEHSDPKKYKWVIGFYWKRTNGGENGNVKHSYCMVPTLLKVVNIVGTDTTFKVVDYYEDGEKTAGWEYNHEYDKENPIRMAVNDPPNNAFDNGQLWP